ncbi:MAG: hypothetical protein FJ385_02100 [Verrucomicrobia bacterium]|nr:hypothetical protein [Verrucomicrobiota bacterium]
MNRNLATLCQWASEEIDALIATLPTDVMAAAERVALSLEQMSDQADPTDEGLVGDELGLFEGSDASCDDDPSDLPRIRLFLDNLWDWVDCDERGFRDEVVITYLHELGHYLGWDEDDLADRGLE